MTVWLSAQAGILQVSLADEEALGAGALVEALFDPSVGASELVDDDVLLLGVAVRLVWDQRADTGWLNLRHDKVADVVGHQAISMNSISMPALARRIV